MSRWLPALILLVGLAGLSWLLSPEPPSEPSGYSLQGLLGGAGGDYARADSPRDFVFPADHGPHPDYRSEWWYLTGNLYTAAGRRFGFQFTLFRFAMAPEPRVGGPDESAWSTRQAYMAHLTLTDFDSGDFHVFERFARGAVGLAGARAEPFAAWLEDWRLEQVEGGWRLRAKETGVALDLLIAPSKPPVLQGEAGLSRKGPEPGNASYYYSFTRMAAQGAVEVAGERVEVAGSAWLDREWSTSVLGPELTGWDWFSLQLDDGSELMLFQLRRADGGRSDFNAGSYVPTEGPPRILAAADFELTELESWRSPKSGARYPSRWRVRIPELEAELTVSAALADQELNLAVQYWEGAVDVSGAKHGQPVSGVGYMELTGYAGETVHRR